MKKKYIALIIVALIAAVTGIFIYERVHVEMHTDSEGQSVSIIGGADGPTTIFVAGKLGEAAAKLAAIGYTNIIECGGILDWTGEVVTES